MTQEYLHGTFNRGASRECLQWTLTFMREMLIPTAGHTRLNVPLDI